MLILLVILKTDFNSSDNWLAENLKRLKRNLDIGHILFYMASHSSQNWIGKQ